MGEVDMVFVMSRRRAILGGAWSWAMPVVIVVSDPRKSMASLVSDIAGQFGGLAATALQGMNMPNNAIADVVNNGLNAVSQVTQAALPAAQTITDLTSQANQIASAGLSQAIPLLCNVGSGLVTTSYLSAMCDSPLNLSSSDEDQLYQDPSGYVQANQANLQDQVSSYSGPNLKEWPISVQGAAPSDTGSTPHYQLSNPLIQSRPTVQGIYPAGLSFDQNFNISAILSLVALLS